MMGKVGIKKSTSQDSASEGCSLSLSESSTCQSLQQRFREDCPCLLYLQIGDLAIFRANQLRLHKKLLNLFAAH